MHVLFALIPILAGCGGSSDGAIDGSVGGEAPGDAMSPDIGGGPLDDLRFAVVGDTRPAAPNDTANYPTAIITKIWQDVEAEVPHPRFAISTGDYMFADTNTNEQQPQLAKYMGARAAFTGLQYPAMGNHECTGATASNCGQGAHDGITKNMADFIQTMLKPLGVTLPYYERQFAATDGTWTAKLVVVACNAWNATQATWLASALTPATTYTFVVRHEEVSVMSTTPCAQSQTIIGQHPLTLLIVGHTHTYRHYASDREIIVGNGGAPLTTGMNYGYVVVSRNANGTLTVTARDYLTNAVLDTFSIQASGAGA